MQGHTCIRFPVKEAAVIAVVFQGEVKHCCAVLWVQSYLIHCLLV